MGVWRGRSSVVLGKRDTVIPTQVGPTARQIKTENKLTIFWVFLGCFWEALSDLRKNVQGR